MFIPWARVLCLIYMPSGKCVYIRQSTRAHGITNNIMFYFKKWVHPIAKVFIIIPFSYMGNQINCDCWIEFCHQNYCDCGIQYY